MALEIVRHSDARLDAQRLERFLAAYQTVSPLSLGELWAWPSLVKTALLENLRRICEELLAAREERAAAAELSSPPLEAGPVTRRRRPSSRSDLRTPFVVELLARMREHGPRGGGAADRTRGAPHRAGRTTEDVIRAEQQAHAAAQVSIGNTITSLRFCASHDWSRFVEKVSLVEQVLQRDPSGAYGRMDFASRDRYRQAVEELAEPTGEAQLEVALQAIERGARRAPGERRRPRRARGLPPDRRGPPRASSRTSPTRPRLRHAAAARVFLATPPLAYLGSLGLAHARGHAARGRGLPGASGASACRSWPSRSSALGPGERGRGEPGPAPGLRPSSSSRAACPASTSKTASPTRRAPWS